MEEAAKLTKRQFQVLRLRAFGLNAGEIGGELGIAEATVEVHTYEAYKRLGVHGLMQALWALGWITVPDDE